MNQKFCHWFGDLTVFWQMCKLLAMYCPDSANWNEMAEKGHCRVSFGSWIPPLRKAQHLPTTVQGQTEMEAMKCTDPHSLNLTVMLNKADHDCSNTTAKLVLNQRCNQIPCDQFILVDSARPKGNSYFLIAKNF